MRKLILFSILVSFLLLIPAILADNKIFDAPDTEVLNDVMVDNGPNNDVDNIGVVNNSPTLQIVYNMFFLNKTLLPWNSANQTRVQEAYMICEDDGTDENTVVFVHAVKNNTWDEGVISGSNHPCRIDGSFTDNFAATTQCNETPENGTWVIQNAPSYTPFRNYTWNVTDHTRNTMKDQIGNISFVMKAKSGTTAARFKSKDHPSVKLGCALNVTYVIELGPGDASPPEISSYNMTSQGGEGCTNWNTNKNIGCTTTDTTPTVFITTNENANCAIGTSNLNYTGLGVSRECSGAGSKAHTCTLIAQDELTQENSFLYIGCKDLNDNENSTSTSGALRISIQSSDLETAGRNAIESGIRHALGSGYTIYTDQKLYARNSANSQFVKTFDKVVRWLNKIWAFNFLTGNETTTNIFNITPVLYVMEMTNTTNSSVNSTVYQLITNTK